MEKRGEKFGWSKKKHYLCGVKMSLTPDLRLKIIYIFIKLD